MNNNDFIKKTRYNLLTDIALFSQSQPEVNNFIQDQIKSVQKTEDLIELKKQISEKFKIPYLTNIKLLIIYRNLVKNQKIKPNDTLEKLLMTRKVRSLSGIVSVTVLNKPYSCPGRCIYCPTQKGIPKSYLKDEPAVMRAILNKFHPYHQVKTRLQSLRITGHPTDKIELIILGGTWSYLPKQYQTWFIKECFRACNQHLKIRRCFKKSGSKNQSLLELQKQNEKAKNRIVNIVVETRPDYITEKEILRMRKLGITRVELGVQTIYNDILKMNNRDHTIKETIIATKLLKDSGFVVCYHIMLNLYGSNQQKDQEIFQRLFKETKFRPDLLKIYPCLVIKETLLYNLWCKNLYQPYQDLELINLLKNIYQVIPFYCRIMRVMRDIPSSMIMAGTKFSNLREIIEKEIKKKKQKYKEIRWREVKDNYNPQEKLKFFCQQYQASQGKEFFLSYENKEQTKLFSLLRLRIPSPSNSNYLKQKSDHKIYHAIPILKNGAIIREVHTYGYAVPIGKKKISPQHQGLGKKLIKKAEQIAINEKMKKIIIISGVGTRNYYRQLGYQLKNTYMIKNL